MIPDWLLQTLGHPASLGFCTALIPALVFRFQLFLSRRDLRKASQFQLQQIQTLSESLQKVQTEVESARTEGDQLRLKIQSLLQAPERQRLRQLEILLRAEQQLTLSAPGFAPAWQTAKNQAAAELETEEQGKRSPKQIFSHLVQSGSSLLSKLRDPSPKTLPAEPLPDASRSTSAAAPPNPGSESSPTPL